MTATLPFSLSLAAALALSAATAAAAEAPAEDAVAQCVREANDGNIGACERAIAEHPDDLALKRRYALSLLVSGAPFHAIEVYREVAMRAQDDAEAQFDYAAGLGTVNRFPDAVAPIERALALKPDEPRYERLADIIYERTGNHPKLFQVTLREAEQGDRIAMYETGLFYADGIGVARDAAKALDWLMRAAQRNHVGAMDRLAEVYAEG
ncbi:MAG: tetratricopeptide repeat protein, partial [Candidatus Eiseniibacteriota bacterium]